jgi:hypothetical protein
MEGLTHGWWVTEIPEWKEEDMPGGLLKYLGRRMKTRLVVY